MVAPHPLLQKKIRNTRRLIRERRAHLLPGLISQFPEQFLTLKDFNVFESIKPWVELTKPRKLRQDTMNPPIHDAVLVLCVDFPDAPAQVSTTDIFNRFFSGGKSLKTYYTENSYGKYVPAGEVHGWYRAPHPMGYYVNSANGFGTYPQNIQKLVEDVLSIAAADPLINLSQFDISGNGVIENLIIVHAGAEAAATGNIDDIWAHMSEITPVFRNGFGFRYYATVSEFMSYANDEQRIGVDCHEFAHLVLGLPDLYDYSGNSNGAGDFSLLASGNWVDNAFTPVHMDAWSKYACGFSSAFIDRSGMLLINDAETHDVSYKFSSQYQNEYFMLENRQQIGFDSFLPAAGILIWKINEIQSYNDNELCYKVGLVQADGMSDLENASNSGDSGDSYPGDTSNREFGIYTIPNSRLCNGAYPSFSIYNVSESSNSMVFVASLCPDFGVAIQVSP